MNIKHVIKMLGHHEPPEEIQMYLGTDSTYFASTHSSSVMWLQCINALSPSLPSAVECRIPTTKNNCFGVTES